MALRYQKNEICIFFFWQFALIALSLTFFACFVPHLKVTLDQLKMTQDKWHYLAKQKGVVDENIKNQTFVLKDDAAFILRNSSIKNRLDEQHRLVRLSAAQMWSSAGTSITSTFLLELLNKPVSVLFIHNSHCPQSTEKGIFGIYVTILKLRVCILGLNQSVISSYAARISVFSL